MPQDATPDQVAAWQIKADRIGRFDTIIAQHEKAKAQLDVQIEEARAMRDFYVEKYKNVQECVRDGKGDWIVKE